ncbi:MAG: response regulator [bacterium]|nr:response regulator [bacterium]
MASSENTGCRILLVEDNPGDARLISEMLRNHPNYRFTWLGSLTSAFEALHKGSFDIVLLDLGLPESEGLNTLKIFRNEFPNHPAVVLTGLDDDEAAIESLQLGAQDYLQKGRINETALLHSIRYSLERAKAQKALHHSESKYRSLVEDTPDLICGFLPDGVITFVNQAYCKYFNSTSEKLIGLNFLSLIPEKDREQVQSNIAALSEESPSQTLEYRVILEDGSVRWQRWTNRALFNPDKELISYQAVGEDVTELKISELNLIDSEEKWRSLTAYSEDYIWTCDTEMCFISVNKTAPGLVQKELLGQSVLNFVPEEYKEQVKQCFTNVLKSGKSGSYETAYTDSTEIALEYEVFVGPIKKDGVVTGFACRSTEVTERNRMEQEKLELLQQMQHAQKLESLGVLAGGIAHDFNNILMAILGNADLALMDISTANPAYSNVKAIETAARRAAELSKQMLAYSGKGTFLIENVCLNEAVEEMTHILEVSISKKAVIKYHFADNLPLVKADATQIRQIIMNLVTNASDAIDKTSGVISIKTGAMHCDADYLASTYINETSDTCQYVFVEVSDTGCGMDPDTMTKLFDPFFTTKFTGRGLGLSAVLGIIRGHRGAVKVYSEPGNGSSIKVLFPACQLDEDSLKKMKESGVNNWQSSGTVLLVDDEETILSVGRQMLERMGFDVITAADGVEAVKAFRENPNSIKLVILDLVMPHLDGEETYRELRRIQDDVCVVMSSGYNEQEVTQRFAGKSLAGFIHKPYIYKDLQETLKKVLNDISPE